MNSTTQPSNRLDALSRFETFRNVCQHTLYDFYWPFRPFHLVSCAGWGAKVPPKQPQPSLLLPKPLGNNEEETRGAQASSSLRQEIYFGTRADDACSFDMGGSQKWVGG